MPLYFWVRNGAEMNHKGETNIFKVGLLNKLEIRSAEFFFSQHKKKFLGVFLSIIPMKTFSQDHKKSVFNLT